MEQSVSDEEDEERNVPLANPADRRGEKVGKTTPRKKKRGGGGRKINDYFFFLPFGGPTFVGGFSLPLAF